MVELVSSNVSGLLYVTRTRESDRIAHYRGEYLRLAHEDRKATFAWLTKVSFLLEHDDFNSTGFRIRHSGFWRSIRFIDRHLL